MNKDALRLEILKLTYTHGRESSQAIERARELESYITEMPALPVFTEAETTPVVKVKKKPGRPKRNVDNSDKDLLS